MIVGKICYGGHASSKDGNAVDKGSVVGGSRNHYQKSLTELLVSGKKREKQRVAGVPCHHPQYRVVHQGNARSLVHEDRHAPNDASSVQMLLWQDTGGIIVGVQHRS